MQRRIFIQQLITLITGSFFLGRSVPMQAKEMRDDHWQAIIDLARWCPSVHNLQAHKVKIISKTEAQIYYDPKRLLPKGDVHSIFATVAMGIFIEHCSIAAHQFRKQIEIIKVHQDIDHKQIQNTLFATIRLVDTDQKEEIETSLFTKRRTARSHFNGIALGNEIIQTIQDESTKYGYAFQHTTQQEIVDLLIKQNERTLFEDLESEEMRNELNALFRFSKEEAEQHRDGLWSRCMGFPGALMKSVFHHYQTWDKGVLKQFISKFYKHSFKGTATIGWVMGAFNNTDDYLNFGRLMARNWLLFTKHNAYIHPFGSLLTNEKAYQELCSQLHIPSDQKICMIFRAGYSKVPTRSYRLPLDEIMLQ